MSDPYAGFTGLCPRCSYLALRYDVLKDAWNCGKCEVILIRQLAEETWATMEPGAPMDEGDVSCSIEKGRASEFRIGIDHENAALECWSDEDWHVGHAIPLEAIRELLEQEGILSQWVDEWVNG